MGKQEAVLKATAERSPLPGMSSILHCPPCPRGKKGPVRGVPGQGEGEGAGEISSTLPYTALPHMVLALKGLRTIRNLSSF